MLTIWKFELFPNRFGTAQVQVQMPVGARPISVGVQGLTMVVWAQVDPEAEQRRHYFYVYATGHSVGVVGRLSTFVGTVQMPGGLVFHVFFDPYQVPTP